MAVVLRHQRIGELGEGGLVLIGPPVAQIARAVRFGALIVKTVAHFMANDRTNRAVIDRRISLEVEKRWLKDRGREDDFVERGIVIGVHRFGQHAPF